MKILHCCDVLGGSFIKNTDVKVPGQSDTQTGRRRGRDVTLDQNKNDLGNFYGGDGKALDCVSAPQPPLRQITE